MLRCTPWVPSGRAEDGRGVAPGVDPYASLADEDLGLLARGSGEKLDEEALTGGAIEAPLHGGPALLGGGGEDGEVLLVVETRVAVEGFVWHHAVIAEVYNQAGFRENGVVKKAVAGRSVGIVSDYLHIRHFVEGEDFNRAERRSADGSAVRVAVDANALFEVAQGRRSAPGCSSTPRRSHQ